MLHVSVVIPTYKTPVEGLARLIASLDRQSMPAEQFEIIFVDDGSPDDTVERLRAIQQSRSNVRVERIENSGWPSKPRNIGVDLAQGEYVAFMDHDDELYPDALRAAYDLAKKYGSDAVNGKESRTDSPSWGLGNYEADEGQSIGNPDRHPLMPMNPHKLYRRDFLREHDIRFPEGRKVMWEDIFFNVQVSRHARVISTLSSSPYYHWVNTEGSGSTTFVKSRKDYWEWLRRVCDATAAELAGDEFTMQREQLLFHQYSYRVVGVFDLKYVSRSEKNRKFIFEQARAMQAEYDMSRFDEKLSPSRRMRAQLLRAGDQALLEQVCRDDAAVPGWGRARSLEWKDGRLHVLADVDWSDGQGRRHAIARQNGRIVKVVSDEVRAAVTPDALDVTDEIAAAALDFAVHSKRSSVAWLSASEGNVLIHDESDGGVRVSGTAQTVIDPATAALGQRLKAGTPWDIHMRCRLGNGLTQRPLKADVPATVSFIGGRLHLAFCSGGSAALIPKGQQHAVRHLAPIKARAGENGEVVVELSGVHDGEGRIEVTVGRGVRSARRMRFVDAPATLEVGQGSARLLYTPQSSRDRIRVGDRVRGGARWWTLRISEAEVVLRPGPPVAPSATRLRVRRLRRRAASQVTRVKQKLNRLGRR